MLHLRETSFFKGFWLPWVRCVCPFARFWDEEDEGEKAAAYIACESRGDWWKVGNALGDVTPEGKKP